VMCGGMIFGGGRALLRRMKRRGDAD
jgi:hypothetical protein